jgi:hypothetical protein
MDTENKDELFSLKLNNNGIAHLQRYARLVRVYLVIGIVFILLALIQEVFMLIRMNRMSGDWLLNFYFTIYPVLMLIGIVIFVFQLVYFRKLSVFMQQAVQDSDELTFNSAFENLTRITWIVICNAFLAIIYSLLTLAISIRGLF